MIFYTNRFVPENAAGCMRVFLIPFIFIRPEYKDDIGLHAHEQCHAEQAWRNILPPIHAIRYMLSESYRLACEVEAYKTQAQYSPQHRNLYATFIARDYNLPIKEAEALNLLRS